MHHHFMSGAAVEKKQQNAHFCVLISSITALVKELGSKVTEDKKSFILSQKSPFDLR